MSLISSIVRRIVAFVLGAAAFAVVPACDLFKGPDLRAKASADVAMAKAAAYHISIDAVGAGSTTPSGTVEVKNGYPLEIDGNAQPEYVLIGWKQSGGSGQASFTAVNESRVRVSVTGGDVSIVPVYELRPVVLYSTPIGNNIAKNSSVRVVFNREIDTSQLTTAMVSVMKRATIDIPYKVVAKAGSKGVSFKPLALSLDDYEQYVVTVKAGIPALISFDATTYPGVTFLNTSVTTRADFTSPFMTGASFDSLPPYNAEFDLVSTKGKASYSNSQSVTLSHINAVDDSGDEGVATVFVKNEADATYPAAGTDYLSDMSLPWLLSSAAEGQYQVSMIFQDVNDNVMATTSAVAHTMYLDTTPPNVSTFSIAQAANAPGFTSILNPVLTLSAQDPVISGTSVPGSGESADGSTLSEQKRISLSNDNSNFTTPSAYQSSISNWNLAAGSDGARTVYLKVSDGAGNVTTVSANITVDTSTPTASVLLANGSLNTASPNVTLKITASDDVVPGATGSGLYQISLGAGTTGLSPGSAYSATLNGSTVSSGTLTGQTFGGAIGYANSIDLVLSGGDGLKHIVLDISDAIGHVRTLSFNVNLDTTQPPTGTVAINGSPTTTSNTQVTLTLSASDATTGGSNPGSGISEMGIQTVEGNSPSPGAATWMAYQTSAVVNLNPITQGATQYVFAWFKDGAGNITASPASTTVIYSSLKPTGTLTRTSASPNSSSLVNFSWAATSYGGANVAKIELSNASGGPWLQIATPGSSSPSGTYNNWDITNATYGGTATNGTRKVYMRLTDSAIPALVSTVNASLVYDNTAPSLNGFTVSGTGGTAASSSSPVTVSFDLADNTTAVTSIQYRTANDAGFTTGGTGGWVTASGSSITLSHALTAGQGTKTVYVEAKDLAGNVTATNSSIIFDSVVPNAPTISINSGATYTNYAYVNLTIGGTDPAPSSALSQMQFSNDGGTWSALVPYAVSYSNWNMTSGYGGTATEGAKKVYVRVKDTAGNLSTSVYDGIVYDITLPAAGSLTFTGGITSSSSRTVPVTLNPTDSGSGITDMEFYCGGYYSGWLSYTSSTNALLTQMNGTKTLFVHFRDAAGNVSSWASNTISLLQLWSNFTRAEIAGPNYSQSGDYTSYITVASGSNIALDSAAGHTGSYCIVYKTNAATPQVGQLDYYLSGTTITLYYTTYASDGYSIKGHSLYPSGSAYWTTSAVALPTSGNYYYLDLDNATWNSSTTYSAAADFYVINSGGNLYLYPMSTATFVRY